MHPIASVLEVWLEADGVRARRTGPSPAAEATAVPAVGMLAGLEALTAAARAGQASPFVVAVGEAVRRALPTAARASVLARAPLTGRLGLGQVGGELGPRLAAVADALVLRGRTRVPGAVLCIGDGDALELASFPELLGASPREAGRRLRERFGAAGMLVVGPAAERGVRFASLASEGEQPSFVGRGGLGAALFAQGLKAIVVTARPPRSRAERAGSDGADPALGALYAALGRSPRLAARSEQGTFELARAHALRGELTTADGRTLDVAAAARAFPRSRGAGGVGSAGPGEQEGAQAVERKGCRGCPTPCGWVFERSTGPRQQAHFGAAEAIGTRLGLERFDDALALLASCDAWGMDAKEAGAVLVLLERARRLGRFPGAPAAGDRERLLADLRLLVEGDEHPFLREGSAATARALGLAGAAREAREAPGIERGLGARLAAAVATGGADPMRSFPFLLEAGSPERVARLVGEPLPPRALDPTHPEGKARLVWWHENLVAAVDASGFCSFSSAGLLADGCAELDELAAWILPASLARAEGAWSGVPAGRRLLALGADIVLARHALDATWAPRRWASAAGSDLPDGLLDDYRALRGLADDGGPTARALALAGTPALADPVGSPSPAPAAREIPELVGEARGTGRRAPGSLALRGSGALERALERSARSGAFAGLELPCTLHEVLEHLARRDAALAPLLLRGRTILPSVWRDGRRLLPGDPVADGDVLELVHAIAGG